MTILMWPLQRRRTFALNSLAFATVIITSEHLINASICTRAARESSRSDWLDGLLPSVWNVFIKASKHTFFKRVYCRGALPFLFLFFIFFKAKNSMLQKKLSHFFTPDQLEKKCCAKTIFTSGGKSISARRDTRAGDKQSVIISKEER